MENRTAEHIISRPEHNLLSRSLQLHPEGSAFPYGDTSWTPPSLYVREIDVTRRTNLYGYSFTDDGKRAASLPPGIGEEEAGNCAYFQSGIRSRYLDQSVSGMYFFQNSGSFLLAK